MEEKNYYDWLEISKKASPEVIEKAYKALVKKYHPDLQEGDKGEAEEIIKKINEAYSVLSDEVKRVEYDATLSDDSISKEDYDKLKEELNNMKQSANEVPAQNYVSYEYNEPEDLEYKKQAELEYQKQVENARRQAYHDAYIQDLRSRGYKIKYKKTPKDYLRIVITLIAVVLFFVIAWHIPFVHNWVMDLYNENEVVKFIVNLFSTRGDGPVLVEF